MDISFVLGGLQFCAIPCYKKADGVFHVPVKVLMLSKVLIEQLSIAKELSQVPTLDSSSLDKDSFL